MSLTDISPATAARRLVPDELWREAKSLIPARLARSTGRKPVDDRVVLAGIVFIIANGLTWNELPREVTGCSGITCWRRMRAWRAAGTWPEILKLVNARVSTLDSEEFEGVLGSADQREMSDSSFRTRGVVVT